MQLKFYLLTLLPLLALAQDDQGTINSIVGNAQNNANSVLAEATKAAGNGGGAASSALAEATAAAGSAGLDATSLINQASAQLSSLTSNTDVRNALSTAASFLSDATNSVGSVATNAASNAASRASSATSAAGAAATGGASNVKANAGALGVGMAALLLL